MLAQIAIEHLRIVGMDAADRLGIAGREARQRQDAALGEHHVAMAVRIGDAAFVGEHGREDPRDVIRVGELLRQPPRILAAGAVVVVAVADPVEGNGVDGVAEHVFERAVRRAVPGNFRVPMKLAAQEAIGLAAGFHAVLAHALDRLFLSDELGRRLLDDFDLVLDQLRRHRLARQIDDAHVNLVVDVLGRGVAAVGVVDHGEATARMRQHRRAAIEQAVGVVQLDLLAPAIAVQPAGERQPVGAGWLV